MSGILEQIFADLQIVKQMLANGAAQPAAAQPSNVVPITPAVVAAPATDAFGMPVAAAPAAVPANMTEETVMALIRPHLENEAVRTALSVAMNEAGLQKLPDAQPHQYPDLYQRFTAVIAKHAGGAGTPAIPAASSSII